MFQLWDKVKVVSEQNILIKEGLIARLTTAGARIYDPKTESPYSDSITWPEWFPFTCSKLRIVLVQSFADATSKTKASS
jgi:hypothetical protein